MSAAGHEPPPERPGEGRGPEVPAGPPAAQGAGPAGPEAPAPPPPPWARPGSSRPTNGAAITSLVLGVFALVPFSVGFGIAALRQIPRRGQSGKGLAIGGLVLSALWTVGIAGVTAIAVLTGAQRSEDGRVTEAGSVNVFDVRVGDCIEEVAEDPSATSVDAVPCADPHRAQVITTIALPDGDWPGERVVFSEADRGCLEALESETTPSNRNELESFYLHPTEQSWEVRDDRDIVCIALTVQPRSGSVLRGED